jgi:hypothetical protein
MESEATPRFWLVNRAHGEPVEIRFGYARALSPLVAKVGFDEPIVSREALARKFIAAATLIQAAKDALSYLEGDVEEQREMFNAGWRPAALRAAIAAVEKP